MENAIRKIRLERTEKQIDRDLKRYEQKALQSGASRARIIPVGDIVVDERITMKCRIPRCFGYGTGAHCPPNTMKPSELRGILAKYNQALFFMKEIPLEVFVNKERLGDLFVSYKEIYRIVSEIESTAFYDGYYTAFGFGAGPCRLIFCGSAKSCAAMNGEPCRFALKSRPAMEGVGMDVFRMATACGWDVFPIGGSTKSADCPSGLLAGIVIIR